MSASRPSGPPKGYLLDHLAVIAGLAGTGSEHDRREASRLIRDAVHGGLPLHIPALCLAEAAVVRPAVAGHVARLVADGPPGAIEVCRFTRSQRLDEFRAGSRSLSWPAVQAAEHAREANLILVSLEPDHYRDMVAVRQAL